MPNPFIQRRTLWWPTLWGWTVIFALVVTPTLAWWFQGEAFLGRTQRLPADVLVVEGWIGPAGIVAAKAEFLQGGYRYVITTSGLSNESGFRRRWNYALEAENQLIHLGLSRDQVMAAVPRDTEDHRTYESAAAVWRVLEARSLQPKAMNLFTRGPHARRSRLVFAKVFCPATQVGVIAWNPPEAEAGSWWRSSARADDLLKETVGYIFEALLNSGRLSNSPASAAPLPKSAQN